MIRCFSCMSECENGQEVCPHCGYVFHPTAESPLHMIPGTMLLDRYLVGKVIGYGGFGVTYVGWDSTLQQRVAIKEYLPSEFATRSLGQANITVFGGNKAQQFSDGMAKFVDEAKRLAQFQNEDGIVRVYDSFEANSTAYIIMEYLNGETLTAFLNREGKVPVEKAIELMTPVIQSLEAAHKAGIIHRDIAPDNIMITKDGKVKLIDFGAARYATTSHSRSLTVIIKPGYSPEEQYRSRGDQGAHTDVYALGAVLYRMVTGETPPDALERRAFFENKKKDILVPPSKNRKIPKNIENAILNAMNVRIEDRTPSADVFLKQLTSEAPVQRVIGKIKGIDLMKWPLWAKIIIPTGGIVVATLFALLATGKIGFPDRPIPTLPLGENMTRVPSVINYSVDAAQNELGKQSLVSIISGREPSDVIPANMVMRQSINAGEIVERNTSIELFISAAEAPAIADGKMPDVAYYTESEATDMLHQLGAIVSIEQEYNNDIAEGIVIRGSIEIGEPLTSGAEVTLYVSRGPDPALSTDEPTYPDNSDSTDRQAVVKLNRSTLSLFIGDSVNLTASGGDGTYTWSSSNTGVATVNNGSVTAVGKGSTTITVSSGKKMASCSIMVYNQNIALSHTNLELLPEETYILSIQGLSDEKNIYWESSNSSVALVNSAGHITAISPGYTSIIAKIDYGEIEKELLCNLHVREPSITLNKQNLGLGTGESEVLVATTYPNNQPIIWNSANSDIATVSQNGEVTAVFKGSGSTQVTATMSYRGKSYSAICNVGISYRWFMISEKNISLKIGEAVQLHPEGVPPGLTVQWTSGDENIATVSENGIVNGIGGGTTKVTATLYFAGNTYTDSCNIVIEP